MKEKKPKRKILNHDMDALLLLLKMGMARFEPSTGEFCFDGIRYSTSGNDWSRVCDLIGRRKIFEQLEKWYA